jgi:hypothetical protein
MANEVQSGPSCTPERLANCIAIHTAGSKIRAAPGRNPHQFKNGQIRGESATE